MTASKLEPKLFACTQSMELAKNIAKEYHIPLGNVITTHFSDGEFQPAFEESVRGRRIFIIGSTMPPANNLMEMLLMLDAAKRASARHITAVMPYFGWARQGLRKGELLNLRKQVFERLWVFSEDCEALF